MGLGAISSVSVQCAWFSCPWLLSVRGLPMGIVARRVVECAFLTRLSCQSLLAVGLLPPLLPVRLRGANSLSLPLAWGHGLALGSVPAEQSGRVAFPRGNWLCWIWPCSNPVEQESWGWGSARGAPKRLTCPTCSAAAPRRGRIWQNTAVSSRWWCLCRILWLQELEGGV